jgi:leucine dehydrogenase
MTAAASARVLASDYEEVRASRGPRSRLHMAIAIHRSVDGRSLGGLRFEPYDTPDDALTDVKRLARAMTAKAAVAGLRLGGAKGVVAYPPGAPPDPELRRLALRDFADLVDSFDGRYITAQDAGTSIDDISFIARFTDHIVGRPLSEGGSGDPSPYSAHGVEVAIRTTLAEPIAGRHVVIVGLGHVGSELAQRLHAAGVRLTVADVNAERIALAQRLGAKWMTPEDAMGAEADVPAPCALGGMLDLDRVARLRAPVVAGAANNQLANDFLADALLERGIVWAPDFIVNAGGLIAVADELQRFDKRRVGRSIERIDDTLNEIYDRAARAGTNTLIAAQQLAVERAEAQQSTVTGPSA